jgi:uncharacterized protein (DUF1697 family)
MRMADLRAQFEALGLVNIRTHLHTGNVTFQCTIQDPRVLAQLIDARLRSRLGYAGPAIVLSREALERIILENPFEGADDRSCHVIFLTDEPSRSGREALLSKAGAEYRFAAIGRTLYYSYPAALAGRRRTIDFERVLGVRGTTRGWPIVQKLWQAIAACSPGGDRLDPALSGA